MVWRYYTAFSGKKQPQGREEISPGTRKAPPDGGGFPRACRKSLAAFAPNGANLMKSIFSGDTCVGENTLPPASVGFARCMRTNPARGGLCLCGKSGCRFFHRLTKSPHQTVGAFRCVCCVCFRREKFASGYPLCLRLSYYRIAAKS